jgi:hypothetical protein
MLCPTAPSLPWVAWASLPHLRRYDAPLRLPPPRLGGLHLSRAAPIPCLLPYVRGLPEGLMVWSKRPDHARAFGQPVPHSGPLTRRQMALPRSRVPPLKTCPALRPRWCPRYSPKRIQDCCLPALANRRLSSPYHLESYPFLSTTIPISGLNNAACLLATPGFVRPLAGRHAGSLLTCWLDFSQVGLEPYGLAPTG